MKVVVLFFAGARERAGTGRVDLELPEGASIADAVEMACASAPGRPSLPANAMFACNDEFAPLETAVADGDEIAIIPPVSGGVDPMGNVEITPDEIDADAVVTKVGSSSDGAIVVFHGVTRNHNEGRRVLHLEYEAYSPMAEQMMHKIIDEIEERWEVGGVSVSHRTGRVDIGETSMVLAVSAAHRRPAFEAALYFVDRLKEIVPIWKKEFFEGGEVWIGETPG